MTWGVNVTPTVPNGDFENWSISSYSFPENYLFNSNTFKAQMKMPFNVTQTSDCYHGKSAVKLVTDTSTMGVNFGFMVGSNGENGDPSTWKGGIPISSPIKGIRGYYKYDFVQQDSAMIIVTFRYHGTFLADYEFFLKEKKAQYSLFDFDIVPKWDAAISPDTVIVGFASSGNTDGGGQPGSTLYLDSISFKGLTVQPAALNGDFERWTQHITPYPMDWRLSGTETESDWRSNDKYEGNWAVKLTTYLARREDDKLMEQPRALFLGDFDNKSGKWVGGMPLTHTMDTLSFWYKYLPSQPKDNASLMILLLQNNMPKFMNAYPIQASANYQEMKIAIGAPNLPYAFPCDMVLMFQSTQFPDSTLSHVGSTLLLDHLSILPFKGTLDTIPNKPNPALLNGGFETWENRSFENPTGYPFTSNMLRVDGTFPYNVSKTDFAQHGSHAIRLESDNMTENANFGFIVNQQPTAESPFKWTGGIPISEKPTGLQGYYMLHTVGLDSAMIMVHFSKNGVQLGIYFLYLQPAPGDWTYFNKPFVPALTETPDSMILTLASGSNLGGRSPAGSVLMMDNISLTGVTAQPAGMNGDFEDWTTVRKEIAPGWVCSDQENAGAHQTTNAAVGNYAMELRTTKHTNESGLTSIEPMWVCNGNWDRTVQNWVGGSPLTTLDDTLAFHYRYFPSAPDDTAQVSLMFKYQGQFIAFNQAYLLPNNAWQYQEVPLMGYGPFGMSFPADSILLLFQSSLWDHKDLRYAGSTLLIDEVYFKSSKRSVALAETVVPNHPVLYPNPCQGLAWIHTGRTQPSRIDVFNLAGQTVLHLNSAASSADIPLNLNGLPAGLYLVRLSNAVLNRTFKLILKQ